MKSLIDRFRNAKLRSGSRRELLLLVLAATILGYLPSLFYQFVYDDLHVIVANPHVQSLKFLGHFWTHHIWDASYAPAQANYYRPIFMDWLILNHAVFGLNSLGWHLATIMLHAGVASLFYLLACRILRDKPAAVVATLVFALHPIQIESVAWVCGGSEPLAAAFLLGGYLAYVQSRDTDGHSRAWYWASVGLYGLALFCKETAAIVPVTVFTYSLLLAPDINPASWSRRLRRAIVEVVPFGAPLVFYLTLRSIALTSLLHATPKKSLLTILFTSPSIILEYIKHLVAPFRLALFYDTPYIAQPGWWNFGLPLLLIVLIGIALSVWARWSRLAAFSALWIAIHLFVPLASIGLFWVDLVHDRYLYMPSMGLAMLAALAWKQTRHWKSSQISVLRVTVLILVGIIWLAGILTQEKYWENNKTLFGRTVDVSPNAVLANCQFAGVLMDEGDYDHALSLLKHARTLAGDYWLPSSGLGVLYYRTGDYQDAEKYLLEAMVLNKKRNADQYFLLGDTRIRMGKPDEGLKDLQIATKLFPQNIEFHLRYGQALEEQGRVDEAIGQYKAVIAIIESTNDSLNDGKQLQARISKLEAQDAHYRTATVVR